MSDNRWFVLKDRQYLNGVGSPLWTDEYEDALLTSKETAVSLAEQHGGSYHWKPRLEDAYTMIVFHNEGVPDIYNGYVRNPAEDPIDFPYETLKDVFDHHMKCEKDVAAAYIYKGQAVHSYVAETH